MVVEWIVSATLLWAPPQGLLVEGPPDEGDPVEAELGEGDDPDADPDADPGADPDALDPDPALSRVDAVVNDAAAAAKDRAYLQRTGREIEEYVKQLDALADVSAELDGCGGAIQAELRMALALAYLEHDGTCRDDNELGAEADAERDEAPPMPVLECFDSPSPRACADHLLELVAEFAAKGQGGSSAPFSQAFGCPHAAAQMSVDQMFGQCLSDQYDDAIDRFERREAEPEVEVWPVPRWASIAGVAGGAALLITGGVLLGIDGTCPGGFDPVADVADCPSVYNTNVGGGVLVGVGAVAMLGMGAVLTITELQRNKQAKSRTSALRRAIERAEARSGFRLSLTPRTIGRAGALRGRR